MLFISSCQLLHGSLIRLCHSKCQAKVDSAPYTAVVYHIFSRFSTLAETASPLPWPMQHMPRLENLKL
ncbi:hypothetical protein BACCAP_01753 [Pseudoflavonifractor capillosus ATCC 29799]|uniref:Uncharacterized protein n=1 Tax=Pseudoflavonifractor capillosus ATCC 29799 TaxID=411467 RepID=A6NU71_9FIRM|nr:hypothetical protein BACCAP_01753 [Pseudoflavonifractor capillosus ATCC 29799]